MKRSVSPRLLLYVLYIAVFFTLIFYMDSIPDHRDGYSDYSLWKIILYFPVLFVFHGLISKVILRYHSFYVPLILTAVCSFTEAVACNSNNAVHITSAAEFFPPFVGYLIITGYCLAFTAIGMLIMNGCRSLYKAIKAVTLFYREQKSRK